MSCVLCESLKLKEFTRADIKRDYCHCQNCDLIFVKKQFHLSAEQEKARYQEHNNSLEDQDYLNFLDALAKPLLTFLQPRAEILDYGSGPEPVLSLYLKQKGYSCAIYDPFFAPTKEALDKKYDAVIATEVAEHFFHPREELQTMLGCVKEKGLMGLLTQFHNGQEHFLSWWYPKDPTHVVFYSEKTFRFWAEQKQLTFLQSNSRSVVLLQKS